ncbi:MAG: sigma-70 family RNA polymerase sigma factor [Bacteroidales bacterium]|nr:sigma-70 family RNA polymerase sigma factor [Bacteroidales bacterium]NLK81189.1 sigma-70 family RNA polymerase sigma factor [Bacteroidales bacterium]HPY81975.1 sigma-70 family RNA polymerase sigma factor [Bacteroidales bacterium]
MNTTDTLNPSTWVDKYGNYLYNYAISRVYNQVIAEDLVQETFYSAVKAIERFEGRSTIKTWLTSILKRKIIDHYRKNARNKEDAVLDNDQFFQTEGILKGHWEDDQLPANWGDNKGLSESAEFYTVLKECLSHLPPKMAATFTMKEIEEYSTEETCKELEISPTNLWVMIHRAKLRLRKCIETKWFLPDKTIHK